MNPLQNYNFVPTTVDGNQFLSFRQPGYYMTDYRNSSDIESALMNNVTGNGVTTGHKLRQYLQDHGNEITDGFFKTNAQQFLSMQTLGAANTCTGSEPGVIYSGGKPLVNTLNEEQQFGPQCNVPGQSCMMYWENTPLPQQGPHCMATPKNAYNPFTLLR
jgi:hypothetical protein